MDCNENRQKNEILTSKASWQGLSPESGTIMGFGLQIQGMYHNQTNTMPDIVDHHGNKQPLKSRSELPDVNNSLMEGTTNYERPKNKLTWKDVSPTKQKKFLQSSSGSSEEEHMCVVKWEPPEVNKNQLVTWKDLSPTKSLPAHLDYDPDSGYSSNEINLKSRDIAENNAGNQNNKIVQSEDASNECSPEDALEYYYDEDFSVQFDTNLSHPAMATENVDHELFNLPQMLNGSYLSFGSVKSSTSSQVVPFDQCELEFSSNQNSMEISTSERDMMCSSDMLELSSEPLFTPTPTSEAPLCGLLNDSLDKGTRPIELLSSKGSSDGNISFDCYPRKENYVLSFGGSQSKTSTSDVEISMISHESDDSDTGSVPSGTSSGEETEEVCSHSFQFCRKEDVPASYSTAVGVLHTQFVSNQRFVGHLPALPEQSLAYLTEQQAFNNSKMHIKRMSPKMSPKRSKSSFSFTSLKNKIPSPTSPKKLISWKQVKNNYQIGKQMSKQGGSGKSSSMPDLCLRTWQKVAAEKRKDLESSEDEEPKNKRYSATLVELYQRMKARGTAASPEIHCSWLPWSPNDSVYGVVNGSYLSGSSERSVTKSMSPADYRTSPPISMNGFRQHWENSQYLPYAGISLQAWQDLNDDAVETRTACCQAPLIRKRTQATAISPDSVKLWLGTKNFSAQFPPNTRDCGVQTSINLLCSDYREHKVQLSENEYLQNISLQKQQCSCQGRINNNDSNRSFTNADISTAVKEGDLVPVSMRYGHGAFYSHKSLPDLSFLSVPVSSNGLHGPTFNRPNTVFIAPKLSRTSSNMENVRQECNNSFVEERNGEKSESMHTSTPLCSRRPILLRPSVNWSRNFDWTSSSSGLSTSSTSSGIDPGYIDNKYGSMSSLPCYAAVWDTRWTTNTGGLETFPRCIRQPLLDDCKFKVTDRRHERYQFESHPAMVRQKPWKRWSGSSSSTSSGSVHLEALYSVEEEITPTSPEKKMVNSLEQRNMFCKDRASPVNFCTSDDDHVGDSLDPHQESKINNSFNIQVYENCQLNDAVSQVRLRNSGLTLAETYYSPEKRPLKSCLRKRGQERRQRSLSDPYGQSCAWTENKTNTVPHRHSYAFDGDVEADCSDGKPLELFEPNDFNAKCTIDYDTSNGSMNTECSDKDMVRSKKSVSFASEVSFHSPPCTPQTFPKQHSALQQQLTGLQRHPLTKQLLGYWSTTTAQPAIPVPRYQMSHLESDARTSKDQQEQSQSVDKHGNRKLGKSDSEKTAILNRVVKAAEALVAHFAKSKDPFDKLRLGSSSESPEVGKLVLSHLCPAVAQVINNGLKPFESGLHVFGRVHITVWRVADVSAEPGPSTRTISDLVKDLKTRPSLLTNRHRFDAFIFGLLNARLLDFWLGYLRHKEDLICHFYDSEALLHLYTSELANAYDDMLLSLQLLSVLPFQLNLDFVAEDPYETSVKLATPPAIERTTEGPAVCYEDQPERQFGTSAVKAWKWISSSKLAVTSAAQKRIARLIAPKGASMVDAEDEVVIKESNSEELNVNVTLPSEGSHLLEAESKGTEMNTDKETGDAEIEERKEKDSVIEKFFPENDEDVGDAKTTQQQLTMTGFAQKWLGIGTGKGRQAYRKDVTEYSFNNENQRNEQQNDGKHSEEEDVNIKEMKSMADEVENTSEREGNQRDVNRKELENSTNQSTVVTYCQKGNGKSSLLKNSFDIVRLFDKLLLPSKPDRKTENSNNWQDRDETGKPAMLSESKEQNDKTDEQHGWTFDLKEMVAGAKNSSGTATRSLSPNPLYVENSLDPKIEFDGHHGNSLPPSDAVGRTFELKVHSNEENDISSPNLLYEYYNSAEENALNELHLEETEHAEMVATETSFRLPGYRYVKTLAAYESDGADYLSYDGSEYLEVLAQMDGSWLYCANGRSEGLVRIGAVQPLSEDTLFKTLHDSFYC